MRFHVKTISKESDLNLLGATYPGYSLDDILDLPWHQQLHAKTNSTKDTWLVNRRDEYLKIKKREWQVEKAALEIGAEKEKEEWWKSQMSRGDPSSEKWKQKAHQVKESLVERVRQRKAEWTQETKGEWQAERVRLERIFDLSPQRALETRPATRRVIK